MSPILRNKLPQGTWEPSEYKTCPKPATKTRIGWYNLMVGIIPVLQIFQFFSNPTHINTKFTKISLGLTLTCSSLTFFLSGVKVKYLFIWTFFLVYIGQPWILQCLVQVCVCVYTACVSVCASVCVHTTQLSIDMAEMICSTLYANFCFWACSSCFSASMI